MGDLFERAKCFVVNAIKVKYNNFVLHFDTHLFNVQYIIFIYIITI